MNWCHCHVSVCVCASMHECMGMPKDPLHLQLAINGLSNATEKVGKPESVFTSILVQSINKVEYFYQSHSI